MPQRTPLVRRAHAPKISRGPAARTTRKSPMLGLQAKLEKYSGPLPRAEEFAAYEACIPGAADRILAMAEKEQDSRIKISEQLSEATVADAKAERHEIRRAQFLAGFLATLVICIGGGLIYTGHPITGTFLTGGTLVGIVTAFLSQNKKSESLPKNGNAFTPDQDPEIESDIEK